ncbi:hypothetical protein PO909_013663 [Leuciscus waleckii]
MKWRDVLNISLHLSSTAASSFSFCRAALDHTVSAEELNYQLPRRAGGNLTWHEGRGQRVTRRTVKLLQQPGTEGIQVHKYTPHRRESH